MNCDLYGICYITKSYKVNMFLGFFTSIYLNMMQAKIYNISLFPALLANIFYSRNSCVYIPYLSGVSCFKKLTAHFTQFSVILRYGPSLALMPPAKILPVWKYLVRPSVVYRLQMNGLSKSIILYILHHR